MRVWFDHTAGGLVAKPGDLKGFEIAGDDGRFVPAAQIEGASIAVSNPQVARPRYVRYGWENAPVLNLFNSAGLPASPFTSEERIPPPPGR